MQLRMPRSYTSLNERYGPTGLTVSKGVKTLSMDVIMPTTANPEHFVRVQLQEHPLGLQLAYFHPHSLDDWTLDSLFRVRLPFPHLPPRYRRGARMLRVIQ